MTNSSKFIAFLFLPACSLAQSNRCIDIDSLAIWDKNVKCLSILESDKYGKVNFEKLQEIDTIDFMYIGSDKVDKIPLGNQGPVIDSIAMYDQFDTIGHMCQPLFNEFDRIRGLKYIEIGSFSLVEFPMNLLKITDLRDLDLASPKMCCSIPKAIKQLTKLELIHINATEIKSIPEELFEINSLKDISLQCASMDSDIYIDFQKLPNLESLVLKIKVGIKLDDFIINSKYSRLKRLDIESSMFHQRLPQEFYNLSSLLNASISVDDYSYITSDLARMNKLKYLRVISKNSVTDSERIRIQSYLPNCEMYFGQPHQ